MPYFVIDSVSKSQIVIRQMRTSIAVYWLISQSDFVTETSQSSKRLVICSRGEAADCKILWNDYIWSLLLKQFDLRHSS